MAAGLKAPADLDAAFQNVSDRFQCPFADGKTALRDKAGQQIQILHITEVRISDLRVGGGFAEKNRAVADFRAKVVALSANSKR